jgi:hypothetical protein
MTFSPQRRHRYIQRVPEDLVQNTDTWQALGASLQGAVKGNHALKRNETYSWSGAFSNLKRFLFGTLMCSLDFLRVFVFLV